MSRSALRLAALLPCLALAGCVSYAFHLPIEELSSFTDQCVLRPAPGMSIAVEVRDHVAYKYRGSFPVAVEREDGEIVRGGLLPTRIGHLEGNVFVYDLSLFMRDQRSTPIFGGEVQMRINALATQTYYYSPACSEVEVATALAAQVVMIQKARSNSTTTTLR